MSDNTSSPLWPVQQATFEVLNGALTVKVYDRVPQGVLPPYVTFGDMFEEANEARNVKGRIVIMRLRVHIEDGGGKEPAYNIMGQIVELMTAGKLAMEGWKEIWKTYREGTVTMDKNEPGTYLGVVTFLVAVAKE